jgi:uncharacterized protein (TIGR02246 family)
VGAAQSGDGGLVFYGNVRGVSRIITLTIETKEGSMAANKPQEIHPLFVEAFNAGDAEAVLALYEPQACLVPQPGQTVTGQEAIRAALQDFLALKGKMRLETTYCVEAGGLALLRSAWHLTGTGPDGNPVELRGNTAEVARRQPDGSWRYVIDHPYGAE